MAPNYPLAQDRATVLTVSRRMRAFDLDAWMARSRALDLSEIDWAAVRLCSVSSDTIRTLRYMQDIEFHTIIYMRKLLATRAIDDPEVATFLACWLHEETFHGLALASFLDAAGHPVGPRRRPRSREPLAQWLESRAIAALSSVWPDFCAVHMVWRSINELTPLTGSRRLAAIAGNPVLTGCSSASWATSRGTSSSITARRNSGCSTRRRPGSRACSWIGSGPRSVAAWDRPTI